MAQKLAADEAGSKNRWTITPGTPGPRIVGGENDATVREWPLETPEIPCPRGARNAALASLLASDRFDPSPSRRGDDVQPHKNLSTSLKRPLSTASVTDSGSDASEKRYDLRRWLDAGAVSRRRGALSAVPAAKRRSRQREDVLLFCSSVEPFSRKHLLQFV
jgi:hypothetical protein